MVCDDVMGCSGVCTVLAVRFNAGVMMPRRI